MNGSSGSPDAPDEITEEQIFLAAAALPPEERARYLEAACDGDIRLRDDVERLLVALQDDEFMERAETDADDLGSKNLAGQTQEVGGIVGNYRLIRPIGEGGFGVVWIARQEAPVRREVALKIVKPGMDSKEIVARFDQERKALAIMDHPNIAKVFDAGTTHAGRPYFVMELVSGLKVTEYCDGQSISMEDRLRLFVQICNAVQHAHQKGIIHRDLKPSNVLIAIHDAVPVPKVIDFGIAKATQQQRLSDVTVYTRREQMIGTPLYMSPEQAEMSGSDVDTRSDIYSLGVLLYELLVGQTPFDPELLMNAGIDEMRRVIREQEPRKPSTAVQMMAEDARITGARLRSTDATRWIGRVRGDLDCIVMKALEKDRARRYESASDLARDIERHLACEPVIARPPSASYRLRRFARRNRVMVAAGAAVLVAIVAGLAASSWMFWKEKDARLRAVAAEKAQKGARLSAEAAAAKSQQIAHFLTDMLEGIDASVALGRDTTLLREILDKTAERVGKELKDQPEVEADLREVIATAYHEISDYAEAEHMERQAIALRRQISESDSEDLASALNQLGLTLQRQGKSEEAEPLHREALEMLRRLLGNQHASIASVLSCLGNAIESNGRWGEAEALYREAVAIERNVLGKESSDLSDAHIDLAEMLFQIGELAEAERMYRDALKSAEKTLPDQHPTRIALLSRLSFVVGSDQRWEEAEKLSSDAYTRSKKLYGEDSLHVALAKSRRAEVLMNQDRLAEAETLYKESLERFRSQFGNTHTEVPRALVGLAGVLAATGNIPAADQAIREGVEIQRQLQGSDHPRTARYLSEFGEVLAKAGRLTEAESIDREALGILKKGLSGDHYETASVLTKFADILRRLGSLEEAEACYREGIGMLGRLFGEEHPILASREAELAEICHRTGRLAEAEKLHRHVLAIVRKANPGATRELSTVLLNLAFELRSQKKNAEAEPLYREALAVRKKVLPIEHPDINSAYRSLFFHLIRRSKLSDAEELAREALESRRQHLGDAHPDVGEWLFQLGDVRVKQDRLAEGEAYHRHALAIDRNDPTISPSRLEQRMHRVADDLYRQRKYAGAELLYREVITSQRTRSAKEQDQKVVGAIASLARCLAEWAIDETQSPATLVATTSGPAEGATGSRTPIERAREAERLLLKCVEVGAKANKADDWRQDEIRNRYGLALMAVAVTEPSFTPEQRKEALTQAESSLLESQRALENNERSERKYERHALLRLIQLYQHLDRPSELKMWQQKLVAFDERGSEYAEAENEPAGAEK